MLQARLHQVGKGLRRSLVDNRELTAALRVALIIIVVDIVDVMAAGIGITVAHHHGYNHDKEEKHHGGHDPVCVVGFMKQEATVAVSDQRNDRTTSRLLSDSESEALENFAVGSPVS